MITFTVDPSTVIQLVLGVVLPLLVGLVTKKVTASSTKAWLLAGLTLVTSVITGLGTALSAGGNFDLGVALFAAIPQFIISIALYYGIYRPTGIADALQNVGNK